MTDVQSNTNGITSQAAPEVARMTILAMTILAMAAARAEKHNIRDAD